jgi:hypothetical protein
MKKLLPAGLKEGGQALLVVLLVMAVILTVVLSVISRSVTDISITSLDEEALRAFSAAEAGIERALIVGTDVSGQVGESQSSFNALVSGIAENSSYFVYPIDIYSGESIYIWFVSHDPSGDLTCSGQPCYAPSSGSQRFDICWARPGTPGDTDQTPAVEVSVFYDTSPGQLGVNGGNFSSVRVARATFDPWALVRTPANNFSLASGTCSVGGAGGTPFAFSGTVDLSGMGITCASTPGCLLAARVRTIYNTSSTQPLGINVFGGNLPAQGRFIESTGTSASGESVRKIEAYRTFGGPPPIFDASVFSWESVVK